MFGWAHQVIQTSCYVLLNIYQPIYRFWIFKDRDIGVILKLFKLQFNATLQQVLHLRIFTCGWCSWSRSTEPFAPPWRHAWDWDSEDRETGTSVNPLILCQETTWAPGHTSTVCCAPSAPACLRERSTFTASLVIVHRNSLLLRDWGWSSPNLREKKTRKQPIFLRCCSHTLIYWPWR